MNPICWSLGYTKQSTIQAVTQNVLRSNMAYNKRPAHTQAECCSRKRCLFLLLRCLTHLAFGCRLAAELENEEAVEGLVAEGPARASPVSEEVLESLRCMEQQVQLALLELKKKDQQLARERSSTSCFKVGVDHFAVIVTVSSGETRIHLTVSYSALSFKQAIVVWCVLMLKDLFCKQ